MNFEKLQNRVKQETAQYGVEDIIEEFPQELQDRLYREIAEMEDTEATEYLITKLINRKFALYKSEDLKLPENVEVTHEEPLAIVERIKRVVESKDAVTLGEGHNGEVITSLRRPTTCYKVLRLERANLLGATAKREAIILYQIGQLLEGRTDVARVPKLLRYIDADNFRAIHMETIDGSSLKDMFEKKIDFPEGFDVDTFIHKLETTVSIMNEHGYFHRDLTNNLGNVIVDKEGDPWIIDFGSALKSKGPDTDPRLYQVTYGGIPCVASDLQGIKELGKQIKNHLREKNNG